MYNTINRLLPTTPSVSGREEGIRNILTELMKPVTDEITVDAMGNLICHKKGSAKEPGKVMLTAHMDEIGFIVTYIEENGFIRVAPVGGISYAAAIYSEVAFENGTIGVIVPEADAAKELVFLVEIGDDLPGFVL